MFYFLGHQPLQQNRFRSGEVDRPLQKQPPETPQLFSVTKILDEPEDKVLPRGHKAKFYHVVSKILPRGRNTELYHVVSKVLPRGLIKFYHVVQIPDPMYLNPGKNRKFYHVGIPKILPRGLNSLNLTTWSK